MDAAVVMANLKDGRIDMVTFTLGQQFFALPIEPIQQIIEMITITPIPQVNGAVEGVINFHGLIVPVVNLCTYLNLPKTAHRLHTPIILVKVFKQLIGLIVDEVQDVISRPPDKIILPAEILPKRLGETNLLLGFVQMQGRMVMLLNLENLLQTNQVNLVAAMSNAVKEQGAILKAESEN